MRNLCVLAITLITTVSFVANAQTRNESLFEAIAANDGFKVGTVGIGEGIYKSISAQPNGKQMAVFLKYNLSKYQIYDLVKFISSIESSTNDLESVLYWHQTSTVAKQLREEAQIAQGLSVQQAEMSIMQFAQESLVSMNEQRKDKILRIIENERSIETGVAIGNMIYELTIRFNQSKGRQLASVDQVEHSQIQQAIINGVTQQVFIATAYKLRNLEDKELDELLVFSGTQGSKNYYSIRSKNFILAVSHSIGKALHSQHKISDQDMSSEVNI